jgi:hypothetical protein
MNQILAPLNDFLARKPRKGRPWTPFFLGNPKDVLFRKTPIAMTKKLDGHNRKEFSEIYWPKPLKIEMPNHLSDYVSFISDLSQSLTWILSNLDK